MRDLEAQGGNVYDKSEKSEKINSRPFSEEIFSETAEALNVIGLKNFSDGARQEIDESEKVFTVAKKILKHTNLAEGILCVELITLDEKIKITAEKFCGVC